MYRDELIVSYTYTTFDGKVKKNSATIHTPIQKSTEKCIHIHNAFAVYKHFHKNVCAIHIRYFPIDWCGSLV